MNKHTRALVLGLLAANLTSCERPVPTIDAASVERIMSVLSDDSMLGREAFTPGAEMAAEFISSEFASIGLDHFGDLDGYLQQFALYSVSVENQSVVLNGQAIPAERTALSISSESIHWTTDDDMEVVAIGPGDNPMQVLSSVMSTDGNTLVLISRQRETLFNQFRGFASRASHTFELGSGANRAFVLTDDSSAASFRIDATASVKELPLANVVGVIPGRRRDELLLFTGHYDHLGILQPVNGDSIANGANDDASGTTAVIELARYFKAKDSPTRTLVFVAFTAEEKGLYGSRYLSTQVNPDQVVAMFKFEMIGKVAEHGPNAAWITGFDRSDFGEILQRAVSGSQYSFHPDPHAGMGLFFASDNAPFARLAVPAHTISSTAMEPRDEHYHRVSDEIETLDLANLTNIIRGVAQAATTIISGEATPTRVDTTQQD